MNMKITSLLIFVILMTNIYGQVIISPYIVYIDPQDRFGSYIVQNESNEEYEISISFIFGFPVSDSTGQGSMKYMEDVPDSMPALNNWIRAFPRKFILPPKQRQIIRMTVRPPDTLKPGTYWTRIVTSAVPKAVDVGTDSAGISAKVNFVLNQVTTALYRIEPAETGVELADFQVKSDTSTVSLFATLNRTGNTPFYGDVSIKFYTADSVLIDQKEEFVSLFYNSIKRFDIPTDTLNSGKYWAELSIEHNEKEDIPDSKLEIFPTLIKTIEFEIP
jgi:hypothetical protein